MIEFKEITDKKVIKSILFNMWDRISEDGQESDGFEFDNKPEYLWLGIYSKDDGLIGMFFLHPLNQTTLQIHIHIIEKYRSKYAYESGSKIIEWFAENDDYNKLIAEIPVIFQDVYFFTRKFGFIVEGINRESYTKNGKIHGQYRLGLTKKEADKWLQLQQ